MSKKIASFLLAALMLLGVITSAVPAMAADGADNPNLPNMYLP